ncbi:MAG TPA: hypothetical protein VEX35_05365 [Allosphingosinicella sp.]|nr:hypothetical protein [Allosphingosinicella sp.]
MARHSRGEEPIIVPIPVCSTRSGSSGKASAPVNRLIVKGAPPARAR